MNHDELIGAVAMSLYRYNTKRYERAEKLAADLKVGRHDVIEIVNSQFWPTEMPADMAKAYMKNAMDKYGYEARERVLKELGDDETQTTTD